MSVVRQAMRDDAWAVARIHGIARAAYYGAPEPEEVDEERVVMWWSAIADRHRATVLLAEDDGVPVGFISFGPPIHEVPPGPVLELHALYVLPDHWDRGIGSRLHASFVKRLAGGRSGVLEVWNGNARTVSFYEHRGWRRDGRLRPGPAGTAYTGMSLSRTP